MTLKKLLWLGINGIFLISGIALFITCLFDISELPYLAAAIATSGFLIVTVFNIYLVFIKGVEIDRKLIVYAAGNICFAFFIKYIIQSFLEYILNSVPFLEFISSIFVYLIVLILFIVVGLKFIKPIIRTVGFTILTLVMSVVMFITACLYFALDQVNGETIFYVISHVTYSLTFIGLLGLYFVADKLN